MRSRGPFALPGHVRVRLEIDGGATNPGAPGTQGPPRADPEERCGAEQGGGGNLTVGEAPGSLVGWPGARKQGGTMTTSDELQERALALAQQGVSTDDAVAELLACCADHRVPVVRARQGLAGPVSRGAAGRGGCPCRGAAGGDASARLLGRALTRAGRGRSVAELAARRGDGAATAGPRLARVWAGSGPPARRAAGEDAPLGAGGDGAHGRQAAKA